MRVLIVADSPSVLPAEGLKALALDAGMVIAADGGAARCLAAGVVPDVVVGDLDSLDHGTEQVLRSKDVRFEVVPAEKDVSDLDLAVEAAREAGADSLDIVGALGGRADHELVAIGTLARAADLEPRIVGPGVEALVLAPGGRATATVPGPGVFSLISLLGAANVSCVGARWTLTNARLEPISTLGLSNYVPAGSRATVTIHEGVVLLYLP